MEQSDHHSVKRSHTNIVNMKNLKYKLSMFIRYNTW